MAQKGNLKVSYSLRTLLSVSERLIKEIHAHAKARNALLQVHMNEYEPRGTHCYCKIRYASIYLS